MLIYHLVTSSLENVFSSPFFGRGFTFHIFIKGAIGGRDLSLSMEKLTVSSTLRLGPRGPEVAGHVPSS